MTSGWFADPLQRHEHRYYDGQSWTENVSDGGSPATDPLERNVIPAPPDGAIHAQQQTRLPQYAAPQYVVVSPQQASNGFAVASFTLGIIAVVIVLSPGGWLLGSLFGILALVFGVLGRAKVARRGATAGGLATAGLVLGVVSVVIGVYRFASIVRAANEINDILNA